MKTVLGLIFAISGVSCNLHESKIHGDAIWDTKSIVDESTRREIFLERHQDWPDPKMLAKEHPGYSARMAERTAEVMKTTDSQQRWDQWMFLAQARMMPTFTENQFDVVKAPKKIHDKLYKRFHEMLPTAKDETSPQALSGVEGALHPLFFPQEELNYQVLHELKPMFEEWAGVELEPTSVYGVRIYRNGSILRDHLDVLETHVISGILHIDHDTDEPYEIQIEDSRGKLASHDLKPGDLMFYESAKCYHQRNTPMKGRYYASIFMHYRPKEWTMTRDQPRFAIPPYWADGLPNREERADGDSTAQSSSGSGDPISLDVTFQNMMSELVNLFWIHPQDASETLQATIQGNSHLPLNSYPGHSFVAKMGKNEEVVGRFTIQTSHHNHKFIIGGNTLGNEL